jgi:hypothetical protein
MLFAIRTIYSVTKGEQLYIILPLRSKAFRSVKSVNGKK